MKHQIFPVIHVSSLNQALRNTLRAFLCNVDGIFLINHGMNGEMLLDIHSQVINVFPEKWIGINLLDKEVDWVFRNINNNVKGVWSDNAEIDEISDHQSLAKYNINIKKSSKWKGLYFGGVAFKYQSPVKDVAKVAQKAMPWMDVITTSGDGTGKAADINKIKLMKETIGDFPLAIASGITPENIEEYLPHSDVYLVATGISSSFNELDPERMQLLVDKIGEYDRVHDG